MRNSNLKEVTFNEKILFFISSLCYPLIILCKIKFSKAQRLVFDLTANKPAIQQRFHFIKEYSEKKELDTVLLSDGKKFIYSKIDTKAVLQLLHLWKCLVHTAIYAFFSNSKYTLKPIHHSVRLATNVILCENNLKETIVFKLYNTTMYLTAFLIQEIPNNPLLVCFSNSSIYGMNRYTNLKNTSGILCSNYQIEELKHLRAKNWIKIKNSKLWGLEEVVRYQSIKKTAPIYDIGIYGDSTWARDQGGWRSKDIKAIGKYHFINNKKYSNFKMMLKVILELKSEYNLNVIFYLHPFERTLMVKHSITPPFLQELIDNNIVIDKEEGDSIGKIYQAELGIGNFSTIIFDRWHLGLRGLLNFDKSQTNGAFYYHADYMGLYKKRFFTSEIELKEKIITELSINRIYSV